MKREALPVGDGQSYSEKRDQKGCQEESPYPGNQSPRTLSTIFAESRQRPDVVDESLNKIFVSVWLVLDDQVDLLADGSGRNFDFELVFFFALVGNLFQAN